ncbi:MAG: hypothetical protein J7L47_02180 [Candidatus Odinarchaeota archaeon]|nr:hypothetical protein [Candidatus Odinarchaeota archaeon]
MLVAKLCELMEQMEKKGCRCRYVPKFERTSLDIPCRPRVSIEDVGIWDVMGYYDKKRKIVTICDNVIQKEFENKFERDVELRRRLEKLSKPRKELILILRELVRLHEHSHGFLHTARVHGSKPGGKWYLNLPEEVDEPLTEFITYSVINSLDEEAKIYL